MEVDHDDKEKPKKSEETAKDVPESLPSLSEQLQLDYLWQTLSSCLKDLEDTPDHHAVLVVRVIYFGLHEYKLDILYLESGPCFNIPNRN